LTDWFTVVTAALWILGLAILLATVSIAYGLSGGDNPSVRQILGRPSFGATLAGGIALFALGVCLSVETGWERFGWAVVFFLSGGEFITAWKSGRDSKGKVQ
jgi:hypothetical protein